MSFLSPLQRSPEQMSALPLKEARKEEVLCSPHLPLRLCQAQEELSLHLLSRTRRRLILLWRYACFLSSIPQTIKQVHERIENYIQSSTLGMLRNSIDSHSSNARVWYLWHCIQSIECHWSWILCHQGFFLLFSLLITAEVLRKDVILQKRQIQHITNEKNILHTLNSPFIIRLYASLSSFFWIIVRYRSFVDCYNIYFILEFVKGYEFFYLLRSAERFSRPDAAFYSGEVLFLWTSSFRLFFLGYSCLGLSTPTKDSLSRFKTWERSGKPARSHQTLWFRICQIGWRSHLDNVWYSRVHCTRGCSGGRTQQIGRLVECGSVYLRIACWVHDTVFYDHLCLLWPSHSSYPPFFGKTSIDIYEKICKGQYRIPKTFDRPSAVFLPLFIAYADCRILWSASLSNNVRGGSEWLARVCVR